MRKFMAVILTIIAVLVVAGLLLKILFPLPSQDNRPPDQAVVDRPSIVVSSGEQEMAKAPGKSGLQVLPTGVGAFATRLALARAATRTIDAQYYIWEGDLSGQMLLAELVKAADRGVRVRLLLDDNTTAGLDPIWIAANAHPNISVRLFNPLTIRKPRVANYLFSALRLNRRMHNKSMTFDNAATVIGGRNVGDDYFDARATGLFIDLDVVATGKVVQDVSDEFETYWQSQSAYPAERILPKTGPKTVDQLRNPTYADPKLAADYLAAAEAEFRERTSGDDERPLIFTDVKLVADNPDKAEGKEKKNELVAAQIGPLIDSAKSRVDLVTGYFVPGRGGSALLEGVARRGVKTRTITNSFEVTDVPVVQAGYAPYRKPLLDAGVKMYEVRRLDGQERSKAKSEPDPGSTKTLGSTKFSGGGESVHAKTFSVDQKTIFIGSFNFDMRSAFLNCEMGFIFDAPDLAKQMNDALDQRLPLYSFEVSKNEDGKIIWTSQHDGKTVVQTTEPGTTWFSRLMITVIGWLPVKWLL
nr:phospholipase D family protein [uncultured Sphingomonas sp.]